MPRLVVLVAAALALTACGGGAGADGGDPATPVSGGGSSAAAPVVRQVDGTVRDDAGRPVRGALVVPRPVDADTPGVPEIAIVSDAGGRFSWPLRPGSYELAAQLGDRRSAPVAVTVGTAASSPSVELVLPD